MANAFAGKDYLNIIERALMMGISDQLNSQILTIDIERPYTAAKLNALSGTDLPSYFKDSFRADTGDPYADWPYYSGVDESGNRDYTRLVWDFDTTTLMADGATLLINGRQSATDVSYQYFKRFFTAKTSGADITMNEFNIGSTRLETATNLKAAIDHPNGLPGEGVILETSNIISGSHPNFVDATAVELIFPRQWRIYNAATGEYILEEFKESIGTGDPTITNPVGGTSNTNAAIAASSSVESGITFAVTNAANFVGMERQYILIGKEIMKLSDNADTYVDVDAGTITVTRNMQGIEDVTFPDAYTEHDSGTTIYWFQNYTQERGIWSFDDTITGHTSFTPVNVLNSPPRGSPLEQTDEGFHVYGAFPEETQLKFPAIIVQQVASGFEEKFFGDTVTFGTDTTKSSGEVYGMSFLVHIFADEKSVIPLGKDARYGQRRLINWMMLNIANVIMAMDWKVYEEAELEILERHLAQWRDIGYMPDVGWYGATAEFDIYFLNKR